MVEKSPLRLSDEKTALLLAKEKADQWNQLAMGLGGLMVASLLIDILSLSFLFLQAIGLAICIIFPEVVFW